MALKEHKYSRPKTISAKLVYVIYLSNRTMHLRRRRRLICVLLALKLWFQLVQLSIWSSLVLNADFRKHFLEICLRLLRSQHQVLEVVTHIVFERREDYIQQISFRQSFTAVIFRNRLSFLGLCGCTMNKSPVSFLAILVLFSSSRPKI
jgi:hypothetical protein